MLLHTHSLSLFLTLNIFSGLSRFLSNPITRQKHEVVEYLRQLLKLDDVIYQVELLSWIGMVSTSREEARKNNGREVIHISTVATTAEAGDILIFQCNHAAAGLQRVLTSSEWDHVAIIVKCEDRRGLYILESTGNGVELSPLQARLSLYSQDFASCIALRKLRFDRNHATVTRLSKFASSVVGKPYELFGLKLLSKKEKDRGETSGVEKDEASTVGDDTHRTDSGSFVIAAESEKSGFFCSELVVAAMKTMGVVKAHINASGFWPGRCLS
jgi:hypothetical protein